MTPQLLDVHHGFNFRDLGGYRTKSGQTIRSHKVIRSGRMNELSNRDLTYLGDYGLKTVVDFRSPQEKAQAPDRLPEGVLYHFDPVFPTDETKVSKKASELRGNFATDPLAGFKSMITTYSEMMDYDSAKQAYRHFFDLLLANTGSDESLLFHCSAGKDRTGMGAVFLLTALGVDAVTVRQDYLASNQFLQGESARMVAAVKADNGSAALIASTRSLASVTNEYLDAALLTINQNYGNLAQYLESEIGVTAAQRRDLRALYLE